MDAPLPGGVLDHPTEPGLRVTYADAGFLLATKLIAQRAKDADDVVALARQLDLSAASPKQLEAHIRSYYNDPAMLGFIVSGDDVDQEIQLLAQDASRMLHRSTATNAEPAQAAQSDRGEERLRCSTNLERPTPPLDHSHSPGPDR